MTNQLIFPENPFNEKYDFTGAEPLHVTDKSHQIIKLHFTCISDKLFINFSEPVPDISFILFFNSRSVNNYDIVHQENNMYFWINFHFPLDFSLIKLALIHIIFPPEFIPINDFSCLLFLEKTDKRKIHGY